MVENSGTRVPASLEEYWNVAVRRRWWILAPLFGCWAIVWTASWLLPARYDSQALILVEQQKVPEQYVVPNVTISLQDRLQSITQQILSRTRLQATIDRFHLYASHRGLTGLLQADDPVEQMRKDTKIDLVQSPDRPTELTAFKIQFSASSPELAQQVNTELTSLFINEDLKSQQQLSESTTAFLNNELDDARVKLEAQEAKVRAFKTNHFGNLPGQLQSNVSILSGLQGQLQNTERALDGAKQQKLYLESLIEEYKSAQGSSDGADATSPQALDRELLALRAQLAAERSKYTEDYPDVVSLKDRIAKTEKLKKQIEGEIASNEKTADSTKGAAPAEVAGLDPGAPNAIIQTESQLKANDLEIQNYQKREKELESQIASYEGRLNQTPETEQQLADISRGYDESKANYDSLLQKQNQSQLATSLEQRQQGEQFQLLDPPSLPDKPSAPNHLLISIAGLVMGVAVGCGLAAFFEFTNVRIRKEKDLKDAVPARILVAIPHLNDPREHQFARLRWWTELGAAVTMLIVIAIGNLYAFYKG